VDSTFIVGIILVLLLILILRLLSPRRSSASSVRTVAKPKAKPIPTMEVGKSKPVPTPALSKQSPGGNYTGPVVVSGGTYLYDGRYSSTDAARIGREGEERVLQQLISSLDARWFVFCNVILPGSNGDLDIVLVGPGGTWVLEVKTYTGSYRVENGRWYKETSNGRWAHMQFGPGAQAMEHAKRLCNYLKQSGITRGNAVNRAVVVAQDTAIEFVSAGTEIWTMQDLPSRLAVLKRQIYHRPERVQLIADALMQNASSPVVVH
jgi:hypothetical protein